MYLREQCVDCLIAQIFLIELSSRPSNKNKCGDIAYREDFIVLNLVPFPLDKLSTETGFYVHKSNVFNKCFM